MHPWTVASLLLLASTAGAQAQDSSAAQSPECFRGRPRPRCRSFWITEAGYAARLVPLDGYRASDGSSTSVPGGSFLATLELGYLWNVGSRFALGGGVGAATLEGIAFSVKPRARYWLTPSVAIDLAPSVRLNRGPGTSRMSLEAAVTFQDRLGVFVQASRVRVYTYTLEDGAVSSRVRPSIYAGLRLGSKLGVAGAIADGLGVVLLAVVYAGVCGGGCD